MIEGVQLLLGDGRKDESGDFTKGADLDDEQVDMTSSLECSCRIDPRIQGVVELCPQ